MNYKKKFITLSGATLATLSLLTPATQVLAAESVQSNTNEQNTFIIPKNSTSKTNSEKADQTSSVSKNSAIGPGYYDSSVSSASSFSSAMFLFGVSKVAMASYQTNFLNQIKAGALAGKAKGVLPSITAAQAIIESSWGKSDLSKIGNNLFGIKGAYHGQSINYSTKEWSAARGYYYIHANFRKYPSWAASVEDHANFFIENPRYHNILGKKDYHEVARLIQADGYATAPDYAQSLINIINAYGLASWDNENSVSATPVGTIPEPESIAQIVYKPGYGVLGFHSNGKSIPGSNYKFKDGTRWKVVHKVIINGEEMYDLGADQYVPKKFTNHYDNGIITIHYVPNYGVNAIRADGSQVLGSNKKFKTGSRWKIVNVRNINGEICYLVGNNEYIPKKYTQWGAGK